MRDPWNVSSRTDLPLVKPVYPVINRPVYVEGAQITISSVGVNSPDTFVSDLHSDMSSNIHLKTAGGHNNITHMQHLPLLYEPDPPHSSIEVIKEREIHACKHSHKDLMMGSINIYG